MTPRRDLLFAEPNSDRALANIFPRELDFTLKQTAKQA